MTPTIACTWLLCLVLERVDTTLALANNTKWVEWSNTRMPRAVYGVDNRQDSASGWASIGAATVMHTSTSYGVSIQPDGRVVSNAH